VGEIIEKMYNTFSLLFPSPSYGGGNNRENGGGEIIEKIYYTFSLLFPPPNHGGEKIEKMYYTFSLLFPHHMRVGWGK
jgi:hypothetical protein